MRENVGKNSGTTVKNSTVKNRKSSVSYTITYFLLCFARQAWLLWRFGVRQPPKSGIQDPGSSCWMADGCTKFGREGAGTFQCPRPLCIGRNLTYPVPWHLSMPWVGPWLRRCHPTFAVCLPSVPWGLSRARPAALKGATGRKGKIPTYVKRSRALKSARSFSPKFRAAVCRFSPQN